MADLEVIWTGAHQNADRDLLCCEPIPQKREHVPISRSDLLEDLRCSSTQATIRDCLLTDALTVHELQARLGLSYTQIENALFRLRRSGLLRVAGKAPRKVGMGRWPLKYTCHWE